MLRVTVNGLLARKLRLALTALSIILGVAFVAGTLVLTDTLNRTISSLYGNVYRHVDFQVQAPGVLDIPDAVLTKVRQIHGVAYANGSVSGYAQFVAHDGKPITTGLEPADGLSFDPDRELSPLRLVAGRAPTTGREVVMDEVTAQRFHFSVGQRVRILLPGSPETFTISGIARLVGAGAVPGATFAAFDLPTAQRLFGAVGQLYSIDVLTSPGADRQQVRRSIARVLPPDLRLVTGKTLIRQQVKSSDTSLAPLSSALLIFGFIALFVGGFTIFNTFSIIVGQRIRELALLRVVGASRRQVFQSVLGEAAIVGLVASLVGLGLGVLAAGGLQAGLSAIGVPLPSGPLVVSVSAVVAALVVGVVVTMVSAISPAWRAVHVPPVVALAAPVGAPEEGSPRRRALIGGGLGLLSLVLLAIGLAHSAIAPVGLGAAGIFITGAILAPLAARPTASVLGRPLARILGISGRLGRENSMRNPRRTAQGATALMVGLALVSAVAVLGASLAEAATSSVDNAIRANLLVTSSSGTFSPALATKVARLPGVSSTCTIYGAQVEVQRELVSVDGVCTRHLQANVSLHMTAGTSTSALSRRELLIAATTARTRHLGVGSMVRVSFPAGPSAEVRVGGIYQPNALIPGYIVSDAFFRAHLPGQLPGGLLVSGPGSSRHLRQAVKSVLSRYPTLSIQTRAQFEASQTGTINQELGLVYALLSLAIVIAFIGVVNTLLLAVFERTHEIGLLRAVGMKRGQVRSMVRSEAVILSLFGAVAGVVLGTGLGAALTFSLKQQQNIATVVIPITSLAVFVVIAAILGLVAAAWPARRAARLNVLGAITAE